MSKNDWLWARYFGIRDEHMGGFRKPILWHLALRGDTIAMVELSSDLRTSRRRSQRFSQSGLLIGAYLRGNPLGAQNLAMDAFNRHDLKEYRYWLRQAARLGDREAASELRRFETRLPHANAMVIGRGRPYRRSERK